MREQDLYTPGSKIPQVVHDKVAHQEAQDQAEQGDAQGAPDGRAAQVGALGRAFLALVEQAPHAERDRGAHRQARVRALRLPRRPAPGGTCALSTKLDVTMSQQTYCCCLVQALHVALYTINSARPWLLAAMPVYITRCSQSKRHACHNLYSSQRPPAIF